jgi:hypothetical protein
MTMTDAQKLRLEALQRLFEKAHTSDDVAERDSALKAAMDLVNEADEYVLDVLATWMARRVNMVQ